MKKTTVRFVAVGAILLLGALALALAHHDARQRTKEFAIISKPPAQAPQPIPIDDSPLWSNGLIGEAAPSIVRANDNPLEFKSLADSQSPSDEPADAPPPSLDNPLRVGTHVADDQGIEPLGDMVDSSSVESASGEGPPGLLPAAQGQWTPPPAAGNMPTSTMPPSLATPAFPGARASGPAELPGSKPPALQPPAIQPPAIQPPALQPPALQPPAIQPPALQSPAIQPPALQSPAIQPPALSARGMVAEAPGADAVIKSPPPNWLQPAPAVPPSTGLGSTPPPIKSNPGSAMDPQRSPMPTTNVSGLAVGGREANWIQAPASGASSAPPTLGTAPLDSSRMDSPNWADSGPAGSPAGQPAALTLGPPRPTASLNGSSSLDRQGSERAPGAGTLVSGSLANGAGLPATSRVANLSGAEATAAPFTGTVLGRLISNQPGNRHLDGSQNPIMVVQKRMAGECQVGKPTSVVITVRNAGNSSAQDVEVIDSVPNGASFAESIPAVTPTPEGILVWKLGEMGPGDERTINLQIIPQRQGELGSTAAVRFAAQASVRTLATLPKLELSFNSPPEVLIGSTHAIDVTVKNVGTGVARAVKLEADLPTHLRHESGDAILEAVFGDIAPGENKHIRLDTIAAEAGPLVIALRALTEDGVQQEQKVDLRVLSPQLEAVITGPNRRYLDRQATFSIMLRNPGTASATNCEFVLRLPAGLNFNTANKEGRYDAAQHAVLWSVPEFPAGHAEPIELTVLPVEVGSQQMTFQGFADLGVKTEARGGLTVEEQGELTFSIVQDADPIELSASTTYTVEVRNVGRPDRNVELSLQLPPGSEVLKVDAPVQARVAGDALQFEPVPQMDGRTSMKFRIEVRHGKVGTQIVRAQLKSLNRPTMVVKEEATEVYNDRD